jgi:hypothetical protein
MKPIHDYIQMRTSVSRVESVRIVTTVLWIKVCGQKIVDYVDRKLRTCPVNNLQLILLTVKITSKSAFFLSFFLSFFPKGVVYLPLHTSQINFIDYLSRTVGGMF